MADGDLIAASEAGDVFADGIVQVELALFLQHEDGGGSELLGDGADGVAHVGRGGDGRSGIRGKACKAVGVGVDELAVLDDRDRG